MDSIILQFMTGLLSGGLLGFIWYRYQFAVMRRESLILLRNSFLREARQILDSVREEAEIENAVLLHVHNSGSELVANAFLYSSVLEESPATISVSARKNWQRIPLDRAYNEIIDALYKNEFVFVDVESMEEGNLKAMLVLLGMRGSIVFRVYDRAAKSFIYVAFIDKKGSRDLHFNRNYALLLFARNRLTELCRTYHRKGVIQ